MILDDEESGLGGTEMEFEEKIMPRVARKVKNLRTSTRRPLVRKSNAQRFLSFIV